MALFELAQLDALDQRAEHRRTLCFRPETATPGARAMLKALAEAKRVYVEDLRVAILDRPRHDKLIAEVRRAGAGIKLLSAGEISSP